MLEPLPGTHSIGTTVMWANDPHEEYVLLSFVLDSGNIDYAFTAIIRRVGVVPMNVVTLAEMDKLNSEPGGSNLAQEHVYLGDLYWPE